MTCLQFVGERNRVQHTGLLHLTEQEHLKKKIHADKKPVLAHEGLSQAEGAAMLLESECHWRGLFTRMANRTKMEAFEQVIAGETRRDP